MKLKDILKEAGLKRFKVYVSGERKPLILMGQNVKEVKQGLLVFETLLKK